VKGCIKINNKSKKVGKSVSKWERVYKNGKYIKKIMIGYKRIINDNGV
jgi:hypothetical protein